MSYHIWKRTTWKYWEDQADRWSRHRSDEDIADVDQHFINNHVDGDMKSWTIAGQKAKHRGASNLYNKQGVLIDKNDWDGWTLQSATLIGDHKGLKGPSELVHNYLTTAWTQDDSKTVYVGLHHWGSLDQEGNKIPNGTHIKDLGYFEPTDERYEGIERLFKYDFDRD